MSSLTPLLQTAQLHLNARRLSEAEPTCRQILKLDRRQADAMYLLGMSFYFRGDLEEAIQWLRKAILIQDQRAQFYSTLATICASARHNDHAARYHRRAADLEPWNADYLSNAGLALLNIGEANSAVEYLRRALAIRPDHLAACNNLALSLKALGDLDGAIAEFQKVVTLKPDLLSGWSNLAQSLSQRGDVEPAIEAGRRALALNPDNEETNHPLLMILSYSQTLSTKEIADEHMRWASRRADPLENQLGPAPQRQPRNKIRIGYVSPDFRRHAVMHFFEPVLANHDRNRFDIFCYSASRLADDVTTRLRAHGDTWREVGAINNEQLAQLIRQDEIDILVDLSGHTEHSRLLAFAYRPAPVQISYLGYSATTGMRQIDFFITDPVLDKTGDEKLYSERLLRLPRTFACYLPAADAPDINVRLQESPVTFISQHPLIRLNDAVIGQWAEILKQVPNSQLIIARDTLTPATQQRLKGRFESLGIDPARCDLRRIDLAVGYLQYYAEADIALDTFPWSGHTTLCDALWMGCPGVTLYGAAHAGRRVASVLTRLNLPDLIAQSPEEYVSIAVKLANDPIRRAELRKNLRQIMRNSPLMDGAGLTRDLETAYKSVLASIDARQ